MIDASTTDNEAMVPPGPRTSRWLLAGLAVSTCLVVGAGVFVHRATEERQQALAQRDQVAPLLAAQQDATDKVDQQLAETHSSVRSFAAAFATPQTTMERLVQLADQSFVAAQQTQQAGSSGSAGAWNAAVKKNNDAVAEFTTDATQVGPQLDQLPQ